MDRYKYSVTVTFRQPDELRKSNESPEIKATGTEQQTSAAEMRNLAALNRKIKLRARRKFWNHFYALGLKRIQHCRRNYIFLIFQVLLPLFLAFVGIATLAAQKNKFPSASIDISTYDSGELFYTSDIPGNSHLSAYENALLGPYGLGTKCVLTPEKCSLKSIPKGSLVAEGETIASNKCTCTNGMLECKGNATAEPPNAKMTTGHTLFNMSGQDLHNWLIATEFKYSVKRIGGISFGHSSPLVGVSVADFLGLFSGKTLLNVLEKYVAVSNGKLDPKEFTKEMMSGLNRGFGNEVFKDKDSADNIIIWFNSKDKIGSMALVNGVNNVVLRASLPAGADPSTHSIHLIVHPFSSSKQSESQDKFIDFLPFVFFLIQSLTIFFCMVVIYIVEEAACGMKHLEFISGVNPLEYWCTYFIWDTMVFSVYFILLLFLALIFNLTAICGRSSLPVFAAILFSYLTTSLLFVYITSHIFSTASGAITFLAWWFSIVGAFGFAMYVVISEVSSSALSRALLNALLLVPECCLGKCLENLIAEDFWNVASADSKTNYFEWDFSMRYIVRLLIVGGVFLVILLLIEFYNVQPFGSVWKGCARLKMFNVKSKKDDEDEDVMGEKDRIRSNRAKEEGDLLIIKNLTKIYCGQIRPAASHVYVGVKQGECLGLLGMNGAGKTTIFKMLAGITTPSAGDATIGNFSITYNPIKARILIGYCPQANALDPYLTPAEHLAFFSRIRGLTDKKRKKETDMLIDLLNLSNHKNKISKQLSGGNKRKLNAAIAILSEPELILLDEPSAGMDVLARRFLWSRLLEVLRDGRCLVLTTHSMEECQALATQVCIMFQGQFVCFGTSQHLKNKFNDGYSVSMRLVNFDKYKDIINYLNDNVPGFAIVRAHNLYLKIKLHPDTNVGKALGVLGELKKKQWIEDYSINQTTLENVFLKLIGEADREKTYSKPCCSC